MAAKVIQQFWSAVRGSFAGLVGRRTDGSEDGVTVAVGDDGDIHPFMGPGENGLSGSSRRVWTQAPGTFGTKLTDSGSLYASPAVVVRLIITTTTAASTQSSFKDGGSGGTEKFTVFSGATGTQVVEVGASVGTDLHFTKGTGWAGTIQAVVDPAV